MSAFLLDEARVHRIGLRQPSTKAAGCPDDIRRIGTDDPQGLARGLSALRTE